MKVAHSKHASNNPKAYYRSRVTVEDVVSSRMICKPLHLLDCCVETDNATCVIVTTGRAGPGSAPARRCCIRSVVGRCSKPRSDMHYQHGPISTVAGHYAKDILWPNAGVGPEEIDITGSYDAFTFTTMLQLEDYGFCAKGEGGEYVSSGIIELGGSPAQQHLRRAPLRGLHAWHEHGDRERPPAAGRRRRLLPDGAGRTAAAHLRLRRGRVPPGPGRRTHRQPRLGDPGHRPRRS